MVSRSTLKGLILLWLIGPQAHAFSCRDFVKEKSQGIRSEVMHFASSLMAAWDGFRQEYKEQGPMRILLKDRDDSQKLPYSGGFLRRHTEDKPPMTLFTPIERASYELSKKLGAEPPVILDLMEGIKHSAADRIARPVLWPVHRDAFNKELSNFAYMPMVLASGVILWILIDEQFESELSQKMIDQINEDQDYWDELIANDFRYRDIKAALESALRAEPQHAERSKQRARQLAFKRDFEINIYFQQRLVNPEDSTGRYAEKMSLLTLEPFADLFYLQEQGLPKPDHRYIVAESFSQTVSDETLMELIELREQFLRVNAVIDNFEQAASISELDEISQDFLSSLRQSHPLFEELFARHDAGQITRKELAYRIREDLHYKRQIKRWEITGLQKRFKNSEGAYTDTPLSIDHIRAETAEEIGLGPNER